MSARPRAKIEAIAGDVARPLPPQAEAAFLRALRAEVSDFRELVSPLNEFALPVRGPRPARQLFKQDRITTALRLFDSKWRDLTPVSNPQEPPRRVRELVASISERGAIDDDASTFPGWDRSARSVQGWWEFRSGERRLLVKNIDATHFEAKTGADLVYFRRHPDSLVIVQYKMLIRSRGNRWVYRRDPRVESQIQRMLNAATTTGAPRLPAEYRLGRCAAFVKLVEPREAPLAEGQLVPGYYVPADYLAALLEASKESGSRFELCPREDRHLDGRTFVSLVQDAWIGTIGSATSALEKLFTGLRRDRPAIELTFAYDEPLRKAPR